MLSPALPAMVLLFGMLILPAGYQVVKIVLLAIVLSQIAIKSVWRGSLFLDNSIFQTFVFYACVGLAFTIYGLVNGNPGALPMAKEYVLYVLVYMVLVSGLDRARQIRYIDVTLVASALFISLYALATVMTKLGVYPERWYINFYQDTGMQGISVEEGFATIDLPSLPSLLFLQPYLATRIVLSKSKSGFVVWSTFLLSTFVMVFVGRRALLLVALIVPLLVFFFVLLTNRNIKKSLLRFTKVFGLLILFSFFIVMSMQGIGYDLSAYVQTFLDGFSISAGAGASIRVDQFHALINAWTENILFGKGLGAVHPQFIRSIDQPWNYELSYVKMLFDFGIVGMATYMAGIAAIYWSASEIFRLDRAYSFVLMPVIVGNVAFLIGNATNPYLLKIDYLSIIFLPVALLNFWKLESASSWHATKMKPVTDQNLHTNFPSETGVVSAE